MTMVLGQSLSKVIIGAGAGLCLALSFAPYSYYFLAFFALILLGLITLGCKPFEAFVLGLVFTLAFFGLAVSWVYISMHNYGNMSVFLAAVAAFIFVLANSLAMSLSLPLARLIKYRFNINETGYLIALLPVSWVLAEFLRSVIFTGFPWGLLGASQIDSILAGFLPVVGEFGVSLLVLLLAGLLSASVLALKNPVRVKYLVMALLILGLAFALDEVDWSKNKGQPLSVALVQGAIPITNKWDSIHTLKTLSLYVEKTNEALPADLVIWPETAIAAEYNTVKDITLPGLAAYLQKNNANLISGIVGHSEDNRFLHNSLVMLGGAQDEFYHKRHLVPFGEYVPLINGIVGFIMNSFDIPMSNFQPGKTLLKQFVVKGKTISPSICYEAAYANLIRVNAKAANILLSVSNDSWFGNSAARFQHLDIARVRARENARYLLRATNDGITVIIDDKGKVRKQAEQYAPAFIKAKVPGLTGDTPFARFGNSGVFLLIFILLTALYWQREK